jgi:hypothetical protein
VIGGRACGSPRISTTQGRPLSTELAEYLGHADPAFTLRVYAHLLPSSHDRARQVINERFTRMTASQAHGTETEQATSGAASP